MLLRLIFFHESFNMLWYVKEKLSLGEITRVSILLANQICMFEGLHFVYCKEVILTLQFFVVIPSDTLHTL